MIIVIVVVVIIVVVVVIILAIHPVSITRFPLSRFSPGAGLLRNPFVLHYQR